MYKVSQHGVDSFLARVTHVGQDGVRYVQSDFDEGGEALPLAERPEIVASAPPGEGNLGAGTGASVGKLFGTALAMKSGLGTASMEIGGGVVVGAIVAVNAWGDVIDPQTHAILAGLRSGKVGPLRLSVKKITLQIRLPC